MLRFSDACVTRQCREVRHTFRGFAGLLDAKERPAILNKLRAAIYSEEGERQLLLDRFFTYDPSRTGEKMTKIWLPNVKFQVDELEPQHLPGRYREPLARFKNALDAWARDLWEI